MTASSWVERWAASVPPGARVLDLACGPGRHARLFAARGCKVTAVDRDATYEKDLAGEPSIAFLLADLEAAQWPFADAEFDVVVVTHYLHRPLFTHLRSSLAPAGLLIYETFTAGNAAFGRPSNPDYLLQPRELLDVFGPHMRVLAFEDGFTPVPKPAMMQRIAARKLDPRVVASPDLSAL